MVKNLNNYVTYDLYLLCLQLVTIILVYHYHSLYKVPFASHEANRDKFLFLDNDLYNQHNE